MDSIKNNSQVTKTTLNIFHFLLFTENPLRMRRNSDNIQSQIAIVEDR